jgi:hypothetical protein
MNGEIETPTERKQRINWDLDALIRNLRKQRALLDALIVSLTAIQEEVGE